MINWFKSLILFSLSLVFVPQIHTLDAQPDKQEFHTCEALLQFTGYGFVPFVARNEKLFDAIMKKSPQDRRLWDDTLKGFIEADTMGVFYQALLKVKWSTADLPEFQNLQEKRAFFAEGFLSNMYESFRAYKTVLSNGDKLFAGPSDVFIIIKTNGSMYKGRYVFDRLRKEKKIPVNIHVDEIREFK